MIKIKFKSFILLIIPLILSACNPNIVEFPSTSSSLNGPIGVTCIQGTNYNFIVAVNSNYLLSQETGSLSIIRVDKNYRNPAVQTDTVYELENLSGELLFDAQTSRLYITNKKDNVIFVYDTREENDALILSPYTQISTNDNPFGMAIVRDATVGNRLLVANITASDLNLIDLDSYELIDTDSDSTNGATGIVLNTTGTNYISKGYGVSEIAITPDSHFALVTTIYANVIFVVDLYDNDIEGVIYLDNQRGDAGDGLRSIAIDSTGIAYVSSRFTDSVFLIDTNKIEDNNFENEVIENTIVSSIETSGYDPSSLALYNNHLYVLNYASDNLAIIDLELENVQNIINLDNGPVKIFISDDKAIVTSFIANTITIVDLTLEEVIETITN